MKELSWNAEKSAWLKKVRGVSFEELTASRFIGIDQGSSRVHQQLMLFEFQEYVWVIPYVKFGDGYFLKTAFPSRKHTKVYLTKGL